MNLGELTRRFRVLAKAREIAKGFIDQYRIPV